MRKEKRYKNFILILTAMVIVCSCMSAVFLMKKFNVEAVFDETKAVPYSTFAASHHIEDSVLFIGTYLIHSQALTDELYEKAVESASQSGQSNVYYKSELASGTWYDITDASGIEDISDKGIMVDESELANLWVTSYTGANGITQDALSNSTMSIFDTPDPYNLYELPELEAIRIQYDNSFSKDSTGIDLYYYDVLTEFFALNLKTDRTNAYDQSMTGLQNCYVQLRNQKKEELAEVVHKLMSKIDSARRAEVFSRLSQIENNELEKLQGKFSGSAYEDVSENYEKDFVENMNVSDAIGTALQSCQESFISYSGNILSEGESILAKKEYELSTQVISNANTGNNEELEERILQLSNLYHVQEDIIVNIEGEITLLDELISNAEGTYRKLLHAGAGLKYSNAVSSGSGLATREKILEEQQMEADVVKNELRFFVEAKTKRMGSEEAVNFLYQKMDEASKWSDEIVADDFKKNAQNSLDSYLMSLQEIAANIVNNNEKMQSNLDSLEKEKEELLVLKQDAIDKNDLALAKKCDAMIELLDQEIARASEELNNILNNPSSSASDKAKAEIQSGSSTALNNINKMKNSALAALASGSTDIGNFLDALAAMGAEAALGELKDKVNESLIGTEGSEVAGNDIKDLEAAIDAAIESSRESSMHGIYSDGQVYDGTEELLNAIEDFFGADIGSLSEENQAIAVYAMAQEGKNGNTAAAELGKSYAEQFGKEGNLFFYPKYGNNLLVYVSLKAVGNCTGYRYIYNETLSEISLTASTEKYTFTINSNKMIYGKADGTAYGLEEETRILTKNVALKNIPYLAVTDAEAIFGCSAEDVYGSEYGVCVGPKQIEKAEKFMEQIQ